MDKPRARAKTGKLQFRDAEGPEMKKKSYQAIRDGCPQLFYFYLVANRTPRGREIAKYGYFRPFWPRTALGTQRNPGHGLETENRNFPALGGPKSKTKVTTLSGMVVRNFFYVFPRF